ncbi:MAG TPA: hypothetical protein VI636_08655 [Candidatus Angelobacter sp.]
MYNRTVVKSHLLFILWTAVAAGGGHWAPFRMAASEAVAQVQQPEGQPQIKLNLLNVCTPSADEQAILKSALTKVSGPPAFGEDFEVSRGSATLKDALPSKYVRLRRDFVSQSPMMTAQYSMSLDEKVTIETLVLRMRDPKEFLEISFEDRVSAAAANPVSVVAMDTPAARIRIERLGKSSVVLARCEGADQSVYEPLFQQGSEMMARYRGALGLRAAFRPDISWLGATAKTDGQPRRQRKQP